MGTSSSQRIMLNPEYQKLVCERNSFARWLTLVLCVAYYGFILSIAFGKPLLATPIAENRVTSLGIVLGFGIILLSVILTGIYVHRANTKYDAAISRILSGEARS